MKKALPAIVSLVFALAASNGVPAQAPEGWIATYDGGAGGGWERPVGIAVDADGAVYVSGEYGRGSTTVKYDAAGGLLWARSVEGEHPTAMALDTEDISSWSRTGTAPVSRRRS
jgi:hypothetical protein